MVLQVSVGYSALRLLCWFAVSLVLLALIVNMFHSGYRVVCQGRLTSNLLFFRVLTGLYMVAGIVMAIASTLNFDGIVRVVGLFGDGHGFAGFISLVDCILVATLTVLAGLQYVRVNNFTQGPVNY